MEWARDTVNTAKVTSDPRHGTLRASARARRKRHRSGDSASRRRRTPWRPGVAGRALHSGSRCRLPLLDRSAPKHIMRAFG